MADNAAQMASEVINSGYIGQGQKVEDFEAVLRKHFNNDFLLTTNSCTSALQLAVHLLNEPGEEFAATDEILVTPLTCFATISAILANKCKIRWVDVDPTTGNIDLTDLERKMGPQTRGVMIVHWAGYPVDLAKLKQIQARYSELYNRPLPVIEDAAHAWDAKFQGDWIGNHGNYVAFSFQAIKHLTTGDGGLLVAPDNLTHHRAKMLRWFGLDRDKGASFRCVQNIEESGFKYHMNDIAAAIGLANFPHMDFVVKRHKQNSDYYYQHLGNVPGVKLLERKDDRESSCWLFTMRVNRRRDFVRALEVKGIAANPVHARCDKHSCVWDYRASLPGMDELADEMICLYGESVIEMADGGKKRIRDLVNRRYDGDVKSFNIGSMLFENKPVVGWYTVPYQGKWYRITGKHSAGTGGSRNSGEGVWVTSTHKILTRRGYVAADALTEKDEIATGFLSFTPTQLEFIHGQMLGDGSIENSRFAVNHCDKQKEWIELKRNIMDNFGGHLKATKKGWSFKTHAHPNISELGRLYYPDGHTKKIPSCFYTNKLSLLTMATWVMDDGYREGNCITLCSEGFTTEENKFLAKIIQDTFGVTVSLRKIRNNRTRLYLHNGDGKCFDLLASLAAYFPDCMSYKLPSELRGKFDSSLWSSGCGSVYYDKAIVTIADSPHKRHGVRTAYCIQVEDNNNFISGNVVCKNCIPVGWWVTDEDREHIVSTIKGGW